MYVDLDGFKSINDSYGPEAGDKVLIIIAERLKDSSRETDILARIGGDEFVVLIDYVKNSETLLKIADKILRATIKPIELDQHRIIAVSASIGASLFPEHGDLPEQLLKTADLVMYKVKQGSHRNPHLAELDFVSNQNIG